MKRSKGAPTSFVGEANLRYDTARRRFAPGERLGFDDGYRLAHLPLVAPEHSAVIGSVPGRDYRNGRYDTARYSLVLPVDAEALWQTPSFRSVDDALRNSVFAEKIAFSLGKRRSDRLHVTLASGFSEGDIDRIETAARNALSRLGPVRFRLGGPFVGEKNTGRLYLPAYPGSFEGDDAFGTIQDAVGMPRTRFYVLGYWHLAEELDVDETAALASILSRFEAQTTYEASVERLWILATNDDLTLSARVVETIRAA